MNELRKDFQRDHDGAWVCVNATEIVLPSGRIQIAVGTRFTPGTRFMGVDLARLLEDGQASTSGSATS
jgi:hypothetical protein